MMNFKNCLLGIEIGEKCFEFLKEKLTEEYDFALLNDLLSLPCMRHEEKSRLMLLLASLKDGHKDDEIVKTFCDYLTDISCDIWGELLKEFEPYINSKSWMLSRDQMLYLANTIEILYAKDYDNSFALARLIYQKIPSDVRLNIIDSDEDVRIELAKIAYSNEPNNKKYNKINSIKKRIKNSGRKNLMGMVNYYIGLCLMENCPRSIYNDAGVYFSKSQKKEFELASILLNNV